MALQPYPLILYRDESSGSHSSLWISAQSQVPDLRIRVVKGTEFLSESLLEAVDLGVLGNLVGET